MIARRAAVLALAAIALHGCGGSQDQSLDAGASIVVTPASVLLTALGETAQLTVEVRDSQGNTVEVPVSFSSSHADQASVDSNGLVTAESSVGSAQIFVDAGGVEATPVAILVALPASGAIVVGDDQIISGPELVNPNEVLDVGGQYSIVLDGIVPEPGRAILGAGEIPLAGRVVSTSAVAGGVEVIVEARPLAELFQELTIDEVYELKQPVFEALPIDETSGTLRYRVDELNVRKGSDGEFEFTVGPFECKAALQPKLTGDFVELKVSQSLNVGFVVDIRFSSLRRLFIRLSGAVAGTITGGISLTAALEAEIGCKWIIQTYRIPVPKPVAVLFQPTIPVGLGMKLTGTLQVAQLEYQIEGKSEATIDLGFDYQNRQFVETYGDLNAMTTHQIKQTVPESLLDGLRLTGGLSANGFAELAISGVFGIALAESFDAGSSFGLLEASFGPALEVNLAPVEAQVNNKEYASDFTLSLKGSAGLAGDLGGIFKLFDSKIVDLQLLDVKATTNIELARSPMGMFVVDQSEVDQDDTVIFTMTFDPASVSFPLVGYDIDSVALYRETDSGLVKFDEQAATEGQEEFEFSWTTSEMDLGEHRFIAFVSTPVLSRAPLEISKDASVMVTVGDVLPVEVVEVYLDSGLSGSGVRLVSLEVQGQDVAIVFDRHHFDLTQARLMLVRSNDGGATFGQPSSFATRHAGDPRIAMGPGGELQVIHTAGDLSIFADPPATIVARTAPPGGNFGSAVTLSTPDATRVGLFSDDIAVDDASGRVYAAWTESGTDPEASDRFATYLLRLRSSEDGGASFGSAVTVYEQPTHEYLSQPRIAVDPSGVLHIAWLDDVCTMPGGGLVSPDCPRLLYSRSTDGVSFTTPIVVGQYLFNRGAAYDMVAHAAETASFIYPRASDFAVTTLPYRRLVSGIVTVTSSVASTSSSFDSLGFPSLIVDGLGVVHVAWGAPQDFLHLRVAKSDTEGAVFGIPSILVQGDDPQGAEWPSLTSDGGNAYAAWVEFRPTAPRIALLFQRLP
jgi:hypothetical protein